MSCGLRVAIPPSKPLLVYDGDCHFCRLWIRRWRQLTGSAVNYLPAQDPRITQQFPEIPAAQFTAAVVFINDDGAVYSGAEAVFRALAHHPNWRWLLRGHETFPLFACLAERTYRFVAEHRPAFSQLIRWCWGGTWRHRSVFWCAGCFCARWAPCIFAFISLGMQVVGLIGHSSFGGRPFRAQRADFLRCSHNRATLTL